MSDVIRYGGRNEAFGGVEFVFGGMIRRGSSKFP